jgi:D-2-hydroxyacid dehydrogenase (NADP+)
MIISTVDLGAKIIESIADDYKEKIFTVIDISNSRALLAEAEIVIGYADEEIILACPKLKWFFVMQAGVDNLPFDLIKERNIILSTVSGIHASQVSEHVMGMMIMFSRRFIRHIHNKSRKLWGRGFDVEELYGKTICILGVGSIGKEIGHKAKAFHMHVIGVDKHTQANEAFDSIWGMERFREALSLADYFVISVPLTPETSGLINKEVLALMKSSSFIINVSRGRIIDEAALIDALKGRGIAGAGLDVFSKEPLPRTSPLWKMENVIITPHIAGASPYYQQRAIGIFRRSLDCYKKGEPIPNRIDPERQY